MNDVPSVTLVFASQGVGGAETSLSRLAKFAHPSRMRVSAVLMGADPSVARAFESVPVRQLAAVDLSGLFRAFREARTEVAYLFGQVRVIPWALVARRAGVPLVVGAERGSATRLANRLGRLVDRFFIDGYIANSAPAAETLVQLHGIPAPRVRLVRNGVELPEGPLPALPPGLTLGGPRVACIANIRENKGHIVLARAIRLLQPRHPGLRAWLVGRDLSQGRLQARLADEGLEDTVELAGFATDVRPFLAGAQATCLPSLFREGMPTSLLESMLAGVPVVASDVGGVKDLVAHGRNGLLVPPADPAALAAALDRLLSDRDLAAGLAAEAARATLPSYTLSSMCDNHLNAFRALSHE
jgi:glycosyltransferase involved in cell wall biosynthesis